MALPARRVGGECSVARRRRRRSRSCEGLGVQHCRCFCLQRSPVLLPGSLELRHLTRSLGPHDDRY